MFKRSHTCFLRQVKCPQPDPAGAAPVVLRPWAYFSVSSVKSAERFLSRRQQERKQGTEQWQMTSHDFTVSDLVRQLHRLGKWRVWQRLWAGDKEQTVMGTGLIEWRALGVGRRVSAFNCCLQSGSDCNSLINQYRDWREKSGRSPETNAAERIALSVDVSALDDVRCNGGNYSQ